MFRPIVAATGPAYKYCSMQKKYWLLSDRLNWMEKLEKCLAEFAHLWNHRLLNLFRKHWRCWPKSGRYIVFCLRSVSNKMRVWSRVVQNPGFLGSGLVYLNVLIGALKSGDIFYVFYTTIFVLLHQTFLLFFTSKIFIHQFYFKHNFFFFFTPNFLLFLQHFYTNVCTIFYTIFYTNFLHYFYTNFINFDRNFWKNQKFCVKRNWCKNICKIYTNDHFASETFKSSEFESNHPFPN